MTTLPIHQCLIREDSRSKAYGQSWGKPGQSQDSGYFLRLINYLVANQSIPSERMELQKVYLAMSEVNTSQHKLIWRERYLHQTVSQISKVREKLLHSLLSSSVFNHPGFSLTCL